MSHRSPPPRRLLPAAAAALILAAALCGGLTGAQEPGPPPVPREPAPREPVPQEPAPSEPAPPAAHPPAPGAVAPPIAGGEPGYYLGMGTCLSSGCHGAARPRREGEVLGDEYHTWLQEDPHQKAIGVLYNEESELIARNVGLARPPYESDACLDCHTANVPPARRRGSLAVEDGISCEVCHGPASGWRDGHTDPAWSHADSVAAGLIDLRRASVRAQLCLGCHLGEGERAVDHALIAAGHPFLLFELDNYAASMPAHWKAERGLGVEAWAVGQAVTFRQGLVQLARRAREGPWPDFADMDCYACHHSLETGGWRQQRGYAGRVRPGLPPWSPARWAVLRHLVASYAPAERPELDRRVAALAAAVERMTRPEAVAEAAEAVAAALERAIPAIEAAQWDEAAVRRLLAAVAGDGDYLLAADVAAAEQAFFAAQTLASELVRREPRLAATELVTGLDRLYAELEDREGFNRRRFVEDLARLGRAEVTRGADPR